MGKAIRIDIETYDILDKMKEKFGKTYGALVGAMIQYFDKKGVDPQVLLEEEEDLLLLIKQQNDSILSHLDKLNHPVIKDLQIRHSSEINGVKTKDNLKIQHERPINLTSLYHPGIACPRCKSGWDSFTNKGINLVCKKCEFGFPMYVGDVLLELLDVFCLLSGGITREINYSIDGSLKRVRLSLDEKNGLTEHEVPSAIEDTSL